MRTRAAIAAWLLVLLAGALAPADARAAREDELEDWRTWQVEMRAAVRDTVGHSGDPARLAALAAMLTEVARTREAATVWGQVLALQPNDGASLAALGRIALVEGRVAESDSLLALAQAAAPDEAIAADRLAGCIARGDWAGAVKLAEAGGQGGRLELFEHLAAHPPFQVVEGPDSVRVTFTSSNPVPLVRVKVGNERLLFAIDTGTPGVLLDASAGRRLKARMLGGGGSLSWIGRDYVFEYGLVPELEIGGLRVENVPVRTLSLHKYSIAMHLHSETVSGVLGVDFLRAFSPTIDYKKMALILRRPSAAPTFGPAGAPDALPFELWGEGELVVRARVASSRPLALWFASGFPECAIAAPAVTFAELRLKPNRAARVLKGEIAALQAQPWARVKVPSLVVGPMRSSAVEGWADALDEAALTRHGMRRDGALGHDAFKNARVTFDWDARVLRVHPGK